MEKKYLESISVSTEKDKYATLVITNQNTINADYLGLLTYLNKEKGLTGLILNFRKPSVREKESYKENGIDVTKLSFIDGITVSAEFLPKEEDIFFLLKPNDLEGLKLGIDSAIAKKTDTRFLIVDLLDALLYYNAIEQIQKIVQYLRAKATEKHLLLFIFANSDNKILLKNVRDLFDAEVETGG